MPGPNPLIRLHDATSDADIAVARGLLVAYQVEFAAWTAECLRLQDYPAELAGLPGRYAAPGGCLLLANVGDRPAGCLGLREIGPGLGELKRLFVVPEHRGRGVGGRLIAGAIDRARRIGHARLVLDTRPEMRDALALYRRFGFAEVPPYGDDPVPRTVYLGRRLTGRDSPETIGL